MEESATPQISVYPNPSATGVYQLTCEGNSGNPPVVTDVTGRVVDAVCTFTGNGWTIDLSAQAPGTYYLSLATESGIASEVVLR